MDAALATLAGLLWILALDGPLAWAAARVAGRLPGLRPAERLAALLGLWACATVGAGMAAGALGQFHRPGLLAAALALAAAAFLATRRRAPVPWARDLLQAARETAREHPLALLPLLAVAGAALLAVSWAAPRPPVGFDALNYHLPVAWHLARTGSWDPLGIAPWFGHFQWFPAGAETWAAWHLAAAGSDLPLPFLNLPFLALLGLSAAALARDAGAPRPLSVAFAAAVLSFPMTFRALPEPYVEVPYWACLAASLLLARAWARGAGPGALAVAGALAGLLSSVKATGPLHGLLVAAVALASGPLPSPRRLAASAAAFATPLAVLGLPFYLRSWAATGNPVYPVPVRLAGLDLFPGLEGYGEALSRTALWPHLGPLWRLGRLQEALLGTVEPPNDSWGLGPAGVAMAAAGLAALALHAARLARGPRSPEARLGPALALAGILAGALYLVLPRCGQFLHGNARFAWPAAFLLGLAALAALRDAPRAARRAVPLVGLLALLGLSFVRMPVTSGSALAAALGTAALAAALPLARRSPLPPLPPVARRLAAAAALLALASGAVALAGARSDPVGAYRAMAGDTGPLPWARGKADCLALVEHALPAGTLAVAPARGAQHAWFLGALPGPRGQRTLAFVPSGPGPTPLAGPTPDRDPGVPGDAAAWSARMAAGAADALVVLADPEDRAAGLAPPESAWARAEPARFPPVGAAAGCEVFRVVRDAP